MATGTDPVTADRDVAAVAAAIFEAAAWWPTALGGDEARDLALALLPLIREREAAAWERGVIHGETCRGGLTCDPRTANPYAGSEGA